MVEDNLNSLAETLSRTGLASSTAQAMMMAKNIMGTEKRVSNHFDGKASEINSGLSRKKTYDEEIQELIQKTSPEKKDFHYMVSGYKESSEKSIEKTENSTQELKVIEDEPSVQDILSSSKNEKFLEKNQEINQDLEEVELQESIEPVSPEEIHNPVPEHIHSPLGNPILKDISEEKINEGIVNQAISMAIENAKPVFTNNPELDDDRMLKELMDEQAEEIYSNNSSPEQNYEYEQEATESEEASPEYTVFNIEQQDFSSEAEISLVKEESAADEEFILPIEEAKEEIPTKNIEEKPKEFKNPIPKVDLMEHFKFS